MQNSRRVNREQADKNVILLDKLSACSVGTPAHERVLEEVIKSNEGAVVWVTRKCVTNYGINPSSEEDIASIVRSLLADHFAEWHPERGSLITFMMVKSMPAVRSWVENGTGYSGAVTQWRRAKRFWRYATDLEALLGRQPSDEEVVEYANFIAQESYGDPRRSAVLLKVEEIGEQRRMFGDSVSLSSPNPIKPDEDIGSSIHEPTNMFSMFESKEFIISLVDKVESEFGKEGRDVFLVKTKLNEGLDAVGKLRSDTDTASVCGLNIATIRELWFNIVYYIGEDLKASY